MPFSSYCTRCSRPLEVESASGLCLECLRTANSPGSTSKDLPPPAPIVDPHAPTVSEPSPPTAEPDSRTRSDGRPAELPTASAPSAAEKVPLPQAPQGYELVRELGIGGMGTVYLAREVVSERQVAIKFLQRPGHQGAFDRFGVEVKALGALEHPNIIRFYSSDFFRSNPYFTTEYAAGGCLLKKLEADGPLDPKEAARLMAIVARAIHAAHSAKVIHRDLKPSNIVLMADGLPKVSDFGLAKRLDRDDDLTTGTGPLGSPPYMAPEQTGRDEGDLDARTDVYGLGATLYHLVTGRRPFTGLVDEVIRQVKNDLPIPPRSVRREVPRELEAIILKCLEKNPAKRYQTAEAFAEDLDRFLVDDKDIDAPLLTRWRRAGQWVRRNRRGITVCVGGLALATGLVYAGLAMAPVPRRSDTEVEQQPEPLLVLERELDGVGPVVLVGRTGSPRWHRWLIGEATLVASETKDGTVDLKTHGLSFLELVPDPRQNRYRVTAYLRHLQANPLGAGVGVYVGLDAVSAPSGTTVYPVVLAEFSESYSLGEISLNERERHGVSLIAATPRTRKGESPVIERITERGHLLFTPHEMQPRPWRVIIFEVSPEGIELFWATEEPGVDGKPKVGKPTRVGGLSAKSLASERLRVRQELGQIIGDPAPLVPEWHPRRSIGIWANDSIVSIKNVTIEPLPLPK